MGVLKVKVGSSYVPIGGVGDLNSLTDVTVTSPATGNVIRWSGTEWVNAMLAASDVTNAVSLTGTQTLTNKTISADNNTLSGIAASSFVLSDGSGNIDGAAAQKVIPAGAVVGTTDTQTLSNKTLSTPTITDYTNAAHTHTAISTGGQLNPSSALSAAVPATLGGTGLTSLTLNRVLVGNGTGNVNLDKVAPTGVIVGTTDTQTLTNKTLSAGVVVGAGTDISAAWTSYTPVWTAITTNPVIGNGTIVGRYQLVGKMVHFVIKVTMGSTTTYGSGGYRLSLPQSAHTSMEYASVTCVVFDNSASLNYPAAAQFLVGSPTLLAMRTFPTTAGNAYGNMTATSPIAANLATSDVIAVTGTYEMA